MSYTVYKHTSPSGKVYIGITGRSPAKRWDRGRGYQHCAHFAAAIRKYGWDNIQHEILAEGLTREAAEAMEIELIANYRSTNPRRGYNIARGGRLSGMSEQGRAKLSQLMTGDNNPTKRYGHPFEGKHHTEESRRKMSESAKARAGRYVTEETRRKLRDSEQQRPVVCLNTGEQYSGIHAAAEATGLSATKICAVCKGRRKSTGGLRWSYVTQEEGGRAV